MKPDPTTPSNPGLHPAGQTSARTKNAQRFLQNKGYLQKISADKLNEGRIVEARVSSKACLVCDDLREPHVIVLNKKHRFNLDLRSLRPEKATQGCVVIQADPRRDTSPVQCKGYYRTGEGVQYKRRWTPLSPSSKVFHQLGALETIAGRSVAVSADAYIQRKWNQYGDEILLAPDEATAQPETDASPSTPQHQHPMVSDDQLAFGKSDVDQASSSVNPLAWAKSVFRRGKAMVASQASKAPPEDPNSLHFPFDFQSLQDSFYDSALKDFKYLRELEVREQHKPHELSQADRLNLDWYRSIKGVPVRLVMSRRLVSTDIKDQRGKVKPYRCNTYLSPGLDLWVHGVHSMKPDYYLNKSGGCAAYGPPDTLLNKDQRALRHLGHWNNRWWKTMQEHRYSTKRPQLPQHLSVDQTYYEEPILRLTRKDASFAPVWSGLKGAQAYRGETAANPDKPSARTRPVARQQSTTQGLKSLPDRAGATQAAQDNAAWPLQPQASTSQPELLWIYNRTSAREQYSANNPDALLGPPPQQTRPVNLPSFWGGGPKFSLPKAEIEDARYDFEALLNDAAQREIPAQFELRYRLEGNQLLAHELVFRVPKQFAYAPDEVPERRKIMEFMEEWFEHYQSKQCPLDFVMETRGEDAEEDEGARYIDPTTGAQKDSRNTMKQTGPAEEQR